MKDLQGKFIQLLQDNLKENDINSDKLKVILEHYITTCNLILEDPKMSEAPYQFFGGRKVVEKAIQFFELL